MIILGTIFITLGTIGLLLLAAAALYIKKCATPSACPDVIALVIVMTYKYVIAITVICLLIGISLTKLV